MIPTALYYGCKEVLVTMDSKEQQKIALFRYELIAPVVTNILGMNQSVYEYFRDVSNQEVKTPSGEYQKVSTTSLYRWYEAYKKEGLDGLMPKTRSDLGKSRKIDEDVREQIKYLKTEYPRIPSTLILEKLKENGTIGYKEISLSTINREVNKIKQENKMTSNKDMRRYERAHINEVWCGDSSYGPWLVVEGKKQRTFIIALIDDASRMITSIDIFFQDNFNNLMEVMKSGIVRYGKPKLFNFDNGSPYRNTQMELLAARIGTSINYCEPYTPTSKSKIERWFRTMKDHWMATLDMKEIKTIEELRKSLQEYVSNYNKTIHASLNGLTPYERFFQESHLIIRLNDQQLATSFLLEADRRVSADNVLTIDKKQYEVNYRYAKQKLKLRYKPDLSEVYIVNEKTGELEEIKLLDKQENASIKREKIKLTGGNES